MENLQTFYAGLASGIGALLEDIDSDLDFDIQPQIGEYKYQPVQGRIRTDNKPIITGTLIARQNDLVPIAGYDVFTFTALLTLVAPKLLVDQVYSDVSEFVSDYIAQVVPYEEDEGGTSKDMMMTFTTPTVSSLDQRAGAGTSAEIRLFITFDVFGDGVLGNSVNLSIVTDDTTTPPTVERLAYLQSAVQNVKSYDSDNVGNDTFTRSVPTSQSLTMTVKVAYRKTTALMGLVQDIFAGRLDKTYRIAYSDGAAIPHATPVYFECSVGQCTLNNAPALISSIDMVLYRAEETPVQAQQQQSGSSGTGTTAEVTNPDPTPSIGDQEGTPA